MKKKAVKLRVSRADKLIQHIEKTSQEVQSWPKWKQVLLRPLTARNGFKF